MKVVAKAALVLLMLALLTSCSEDISKAVSGASVEVISMRQVVSDPEIKADILAEQDALVAQIDGEHAANTVLLNKNQITIEEYVSRSATLNEAKIAGLAEIEHRYKSTTSIWGPLEVTLLFSNNKPSSTDVAITIEAVFYNGTKGTLTGYPEPLIAYDSYQEAVSFRTGKYVKSITSINIVAR